jgi:hypothetical protein
VTDGNPQAPALSPLEHEVLQAAFYDGAFHVQDGLILAVKSQVGFRGVEAVQAFRSLRVRNYLKWSGHSVVGGELYEITDDGRKAFEASKAAKGALP